jgi:glycerol-3-phosphate dehydrogenase (NAD(P)+)
MPLLFAYLRLTHTGREHVPRDGPVLIVANHRSFLDPFLTGTDRKSTRLNSSHK